MTPELLAGLQALSNLHKVELVGAAKLVVVGEGYEVKPELTV